MNVGDFAKRTRTVTQSDVNAFVALTGDTNPIHTGENGIVHGMFSASMLSTLIGTQLPGPGSVWVRSNLAFLWPVRVGDKLTAMATVRSATGNFATLDVSIVNEKNKIVLTGDCLVRVP